MESQLLATFEKGPDLELHLRRVTAMGQSYFDLRDWIISLGEYGRGYLLPDNPQLLHHLADAFMTKLRGPVTVPKASPIACWVSRIDVEGQDAIELRDINTGSLSQGDGYWVPRSEAVGIAAVLDGADDAVRVVRAVPKPSNLKDVRCPSCKRRLGYIEPSQEQRNAVFCSEWCFEEGPMERNEERNSVWTMLKLSGVQVIQIAREYETSHPGVLRIVQRRLK